MDDSLKKIQEEVANSDAERIEVYLKMLDRILLHTLVANTMPKEVLTDVIDLWDKVIKKGIDMESSRKTNFLESTSLGRLAKYKGEGDGEEHRLHCLKQMEVAKKIINNNFRLGEDTEEIED